MVGSCKSAGRTGLLLIIIKPIQMGLGLTGPIAGSDAVSQYHEPLGSQFNDLKTCPERYLLWFHHLPWDYKMKSGRTLWDEICYNYDTGVKQVREFQKIWDKVEALCGYMNGLLWFKANYAHNAGMPRYGKMPACYIFRNSAGNQSLMI